MRTDRRRTKRFSVNLDASFRRLAPDSTKATVQNLSAGGAFLLTDSPPELGEFIELCSGTSLQTIGTVVYVAEIRKNLHGFAVRFMPDTSKTSRDVEKPMESPTWVLRLRGVRQEAFKYYVNLRKVRKYVAENFTDDLSLERVAEIAAQEKTYFSKFFHEKVGITYSEWLQYTRVSRAIEVMRTTDHSITEAAHAAGFGDLRTFERTFKKWTAMVPRDFKKLVSPSGKNNVPNS